MKKFICLFIAAFLIGFEVSNAQQFNIYSIDTSAFPTMKATFYARTQSGSEFTNVQVSDFDLWENGVLMNATLSIDCKKVNYFPPVAVHFMLDASTSMGEDAGNGESRLKWVRDGVNIFLDTLHLDPPSEIAALSFAGQVKSYSGFVDEDSLRRWAAISMKVESGSTDFGPPYVQKTGIANGALFNLATRDPQLRRVGIFLTDGEPERAFTKAVVDSIIRVAKREKIQCYAIIITNNVNPDIWYICQMTGGKVYQVWNKNDMLNAFREIVGDIQNQSTCKLVWTSPFGCDDVSRQRTLKARFNRIPDSVSVNYLAPTTSIANVSLSKNQIKFGKLGDGAVKQELTLSAPVADMTISGFAFNPNGGKYSIDWNGKNLPFVITKGSSHKIFLNYIESPPTSSQETILNLSGTPCNPPPVSLIAPCGGQIQASVDFSDVAIQSTSDKTVNCIYQNITPIPVSGNVTLAGADAGEFELVQGAGAFTLQPTECLNLVLRFKPTTTPGAKSAKVMYNTDADCGTAETQLTGNAIQSAFPMPTLDFGNRRVLSTNDSVYIIRNTSPVGVKVTAIALQNNDANFEISSFTVPKDLAVNDTMHVQVRFTPQAEFTQDNFLELTLENVPGKQSGRLTGFGTLPKITAPDVTFNPTKVLAVSGRDLVITNPSTTEDLKIHDIVMRVQNSFRIKSGTNVKNLIVVKNGGSINIPLEFTPQSAGLIRDTLLVQCDATTGNSPWKINDSVAISGLGLGLDVTPSPFDFGTVSTCGSKDQTFVVDNSKGTSDIVFSSQTITGSGAASFTVVPPQLNLVAVGQKGNIIIRFSPKSTGAITATLELRTNNGDADIQLSGTGTNVIVKPDITEPITGSVMPNIVYPVEFEMNIPNLDGATVSSMNIEISFYDMALLYPANPTDFTVTSLSGWTWTTDASVKGKVVFKGSGTPISTQKDLKFLVNFKTFLSDKSTSNFIVKPSFPTQPCITALSDTLNLKIITCYTEGRLISVSSEEYQLHDISPNPAQDNIELNYSLSFDGLTKIEIVNSLGQIVKTIINGKIRKGEHSLEISTTDLPSGIYFVRFESGHYVQVKNLIINK